MVALVAKRRQKEASVLGAAVAAHLFQLSLLRADAQWHLL